MKRFHLSFGIVVLIVFILTGQYMDRYHKHLREMPDLPRMLYRSRHIYLLLAGLLHTSLGIYFRYAQEQWRKVVQRLGSALMTMATALLLIAFFDDPKRSDYVTPYSRWGIYVIVAGTVFHLISHEKQKDAG